MKIGLVEDEKNLSLLVTKYLVNEGYEVISFTTGEDAINHINEDYHLWILDIMLPGVTTGYDLLKKISREQNIAVFISSHILKEIELICDRIAIIDNGTILEVKDMNDIKEDKLQVSFELSPLDKAEEILKNKNVSFEIKENQLKISIPKEKIPKYNKLKKKKKIDVYQIRKDIKSLQDEFIEKTKGTKAQIK